MLNLRVLLPFFFLCYSAAPCLFADGEGKLGDARKPDLPVVEIFYSTLGGLQYSIEGTPLTGYREIEELLRPLGDYEANRLLKRSESSDLLGKILSLAGFAVLATGITGVLTTSSGDDQRLFWITAAGGGLVYNISGLFRSEAQTAKFNCLQRYNRFARGQEHVLPKETEDERSLMDFGTGKAPEDPKVKAPVK